MVIIIISSIAFVLQFALLIVWGRRALVNRRRRKLFTKIIEFHSENYEELISKILSNGDAHEYAMEYLQKYEDIGSLYFSGCTLGELREAFVKLKSSYGEYIPRIKEELRNSNIDSLLLEKENK